MVSHRGSTLIARHDPVPFFDLEINDQANKLIKQCLRDLTNDLSRERSILREKILTD